LAQIDPIGLVPVQGIARHFTIVLEYNGPVLTGEPHRHARFKLRRGHAIAMPLISDELLVHPRQARNIRWNCESVIQAHPSFCLRD
jgi:hypothetical protein